MSIIHFVPVSFYTPETSEKEKFSEVFLGYITEQWHKMGQKLLFNESRCEKKTSLTH